MSQAAILMDVRVLPERLDFVGGFHCKPSYRSIRNETSDHSLIMNIQFLTPAMLGLLACLITGCLSRQTLSLNSADVVYRNGRIYTVNEARPWSEAVATREGKFIVVGSNADVDEVTGARTTVVDLAGRFVMPGIVDMHAHPFTGIEMGTGGINLTEPGDPEAILATVKEYVAEHPDKPFIMGGNWNVGGIFENDSPDKKLLDAIAPDIPIFLLSQSGHSAWVNSKALELAGIDESYENQGAYIFDRYEGTKEPSGTVRESAMVLIVSALGYMAPEDFKPFLGPELERYSRYGVTAIQPAEGSRTWLLAAAALEREGGLNVRLFPALDWLTSQLRALDDEETLAFIDDWESYQTELIRTHYVKIFGDGAVDSHTALLKEPYADAPGTVGAMYLPVETYRKAILDYHSRGITVHVHVLGDGTATRIIDIFEEAEATAPDSEGILHLAHNQLIADEDLDRLAALKRATMNFSPMLAVGHPQMDVFLKIPLGEERHQQVFPARAAIEKGIPVGFGSDFPSSLVPDPNAFFYMQGWVTRQFPGSDEYGTVNEGQAISVAQAIRGFTLGGAEALGAHYSRQFGSIEVGKSADMVVLDRNLLEISPGEIHQTEVEQTIFMGRVVFDRAQAMETLNVVKIKITNTNLQNAVDVADLNLLVADEQWGGGCSCFAQARSAGIDPGARRAPAQVTEAFTTLSGKGYQFARPARTVYWKQTDSTYWIQWTLKDDVAVLWAYDPIEKIVVEVLRVREN
jgi:predicted amidohydrolase YtcJ